jgi:hypothetical protein
MKAYSGLLSFGHIETTGADRENSACFISIPFFYFACEVTNNSAKHQTNAIFYVRKIPAFIGLKHATLSTNNPSLSLNKARLSPNNAGLSFTKEGHKVTIVPFGMPKTTSEGEIFMCIY